VGGKEGGGKMSKAGESRRKEGQRGRHKRGTRRNFKTGIPIAVGEIVVPGGHVVVGTRLKLMEASIEVLEKEEQGGTRREEQGEGGGREEKDTCW
jgi:hypothetical protein